MNYFIAFIREDEFEWCVLQTTDEEYAYRAFEDISAPPRYNMELRCTKEDIETYRTYEVLRYDHSQFETEAEIKKKKMKDDIRAFREKVIEWARQTGKGMNELLGMSDSIADKYQSLNVYADDLFNEYLPTDSYPFELSFDEQYSEIYYWASKIEELMESEEE